MKNVYLAIAVKLLVLSYFDAYTQTRPSSTISQNIYGVCVGCQISNANNAWDNDISTFTSLEVNLAGLGGRGEVEYGFTSSIPQNDLIKFNLQFSGGGLLTGLANTEIFQRLSVQLLDNSGGVLATYNNLNTAQIDVISGADNTFELRIINPDAATRRIRIISGDLLSLGLASRDLYIYDILHTENQIIPVSTVESSGIANTLLCVGCVVQNDTHATSTFDLNSSYTNFSVPLSVNLGAGYLYSRYTWGGTQYSGNDYDIYLTFENPNLLTLGSELLFLEDNNISVLITYADGSSESIQYGDPKLVAADVLGVGSGRFYMQIDADDTKSISKVEPRFGGSLVNGINVLRLYNVFVAESSATPPSVGDNEATATISTALRIDEYVNGQTLLTVSDNDGLLTSAVISSGSLPLGTQLDPISGEITVSDVSNLQDGDFDISIETTDVLGGSSTIDVTLSIKPADQEAVYTVLPALPISDYTIGDTLAVAADADGNITAAIKDSGDLPVGTNLNADGSITVGDPSLLQAGIHTSNVTTTDENGGTTSNTVAITLHPADQEAVYTVIPAKPVDMYNDNDILATVIDANGGITQAELESGSLPPGVVLDTDGTIIVNNATSLVAGSYPLDIKTTDLNGGTSNNIVTIIINPSDTEAVYSVLPAKNSDLYANGDVVASVSDADGAIVSATIGAGTLPTGMSLATDGEITVADESLISNGSTVVTVTTTDENGGTTDNVIAITVNAGGDPDIEAVYTVSDSKPVNDYVNGDVVATVNDEDGAIVSASVLVGSIPAGMTLNADGSITISDASSIVEGSNAIVILTTDVLGGTSSSNVNITTNPVDLESVYTLLPTLPANDYDNGDTLATVEDLNGDIVSATIDAGSLPNGVSIENDGTIIVTDESLLLSGENTLTVVTTDENGGTSDNTISLVILPDDEESVYDVTEASPVDELNNGDTLATVTDANGVIIDAIVVGVIPDGIDVSVDGTVTVSDSSLLTPGDVVLTIITTDENGGITENIVTISIGTADNEAIYTIEPPKRVDQYENKEIIATVSDEDGEIISAEINSGILPAGLDLLDNGSIIVDDSSALVAGTYNVDITTEDENGGNTTSQVELQINEGDQEAVYMVYEAKSVDSYSSDDTLATVSDGDGQIVTSTVISGTLPAGTAIAADGMISVTNEEMLIAGTYPISIHTIDELGGSTNNTINIVINSNSSTGSEDADAEYTVEDTKPADEYNEGDIIATVSDPDGAIDSAYVKEGVIPEGLILLPDGTIKVEDSTKLVPQGVVITISTIDENGGTTDSQLTLSIGQNDKEAEYTVFESKTVENYATNDTLASVSDPDGHIVNAILLEGELPEGVVLSNDGTITISDTGVLVAGKSTVTIKTEDEKGGITEHQMLLEIYPDEVDTPEVEVKNPKPSDEYQAGDTLIIVRTDTVFIEVIVDRGNLPPGVEVDDDGNVIVDTPEDLEPGEYIITIVYIYPDGSEESEDVPVVILNPLRPVEPLSGFSPDGDGQNDFWQIIDIEHHPNNHVKIYNRWGELVFVQNNYDNQSNSWKGNANVGSMRTGSGKLPSSTYFYILDLKNGNAPITGYIVLKY